MNSRHFITPLLIAFPACKTRGHDVVGCKGGHHCNTNLTSVPSPPKLLSRGLTGGQNITSRSVCGGISTSAALVKQPSLSGAHTFSQFFHTWGKTAACVVISQLWMELFNLQHRFLFSSEGAVAAVCLSVLCKKKKKKLTFNHPDLF